MSDLDDMIERIDGEQLDRGRLKCVIDDENDMLVDELTGIDVIVVTPGRSSALVARISWGEGDIAADLSLFIDGQFVDSDGIALDGTTSVWATRQ